MQFKQCEGHCRVPDIFELDGFRLGRWVSRQRKNKDRLTSKQLEKLDSLGFIWDPLTEAWEEGFRKLQQFKKAEGHCRVPAILKLEGFSIGNWVQVQRRRKDSMPPDRKQRLDDIGFIWDAKRVKT